MHRLTVATEVFLVLALAASAFAEAKVRVPALWPDASNSFSMGLRGLASPLGPRCKACFC